MRVKDYKKLLELLNQLTDLESYMVNNPDEFIDVSSYPLDKFEKDYILKEDVEGIPTSYPNEEVEENQFAIRRKHRYVAMPRHRHEYIEIVYVLEGTSVHNIDGNEIKMNKGDLCIFNKNVIHDSVPLNASDTVINILLTSEFFDTNFMYLLSDNNYISNFIINSLYSKSKSQKYLTLHAAEHSTLKLMLQHLLYEYYSSNNSRAVINGYFLIIFTEISRILIEVAGISIESERHKVRKQLLKYINKNYKDVSLTSIARDFNFHPNYLSSLIKKEFGKNLKDILTDRRMAEAAILLKNTDITVENIVSEIGYSNTSHFYKLFDKMYGMTPLEYRNKTST